jgi:CheY-like chemotaxis protein
LDSSSILIVDDDHDIQDCLAEAISSQHYKVFTAGNGLEALRKLRVSEAPSVIILDLMMPVMNGWEFLTACQKDPRLAKIPVVILSAIANKDTAYGATDFLRKPVNLDQLLDKLERLAHQKETEPPEKTTPRTLH